MNLEELVSEVEVMVEDPSFGHDEIVNKINECVKMAAGLVSLPHLKRMGVVSTVLSQAWVSLTSVGGSETFSGTLRFVKTSEDVIPTVYPTVEQMLTDYDMTSAGSIEAVALEGSTLWYYRIPETEEVLTIIYYVNPQILKMNEDIPSDFPEHIHRKLFAHGTASIIYDLIENTSEVEGKKVKTAEHHWQSFDERNPESGIMLLKRWLSKNKVHHISSMWNI